MLPGPFVMPTLRNLPYYLPQSVAWILLVVAGLILGITLFRVLSAKSSDRASRFIGFIFAVVIVMIFYAVIMNAPALGVILRRFGNSIIRRF